MHKCIICGGVSREPFTYLNSKIPAVIPICLMCGSQPNSITLVMEAIWKRIEKMQTVVNQLIDSNFELTQLIQKLVSPQGVAVLRSLNIPEINHPTTNQEGSTP